MKLSDFLTDHNSDGDAVQALSLGLGVGLIVFSGYIAFVKQSFDPITYATGAAALIAAAGGGSRLKNGKTPLQTREANGKTPLQTRDDTPANRIS